MIKILIADDHPVVRYGLRLAFEHQPEMTIVAEAANSTDIFMALRQQPCDVLVTDYSMPEGQFGDGLPMLKTIKRHFPDIKVVVITMLDNPALLRNICKIGVDAIVSKKDVSDQLIEAIRLALAGQFYESDYFSSLRQMHQTPGLKETLSPKETEVLRLVASGMTVVEVAQATCRSTKTISTQKVQGMHKLGLKNDHDLFQYATASGLIQSYSGLNK